MGLIQLSENTIHRHRRAHETHSSRAATTLTTMVTLLILVALGALVYHYATNARPHVATTAPAPLSVVSIHDTAQASDQS